MKKKLQCLISQLKVAKYDELKSILEAKDKTLRKNLQELLNERAILLIEDKFIPGPNIEVKEKEYNEFEFENREIDWKKVANIVLKEFKEETNELKENIRLLKQEPRKLELRYFDLSIKYHEFYRYFYNNYKTDFLIPLKEELKKCREMLSKLEYR